MEPSKLSPHPVSPHDTVAALLGATMLFVESSRLVRALSDVTFEVREGEIFGLLGPKDSGKSTALKILAGRLRPTEGKARVFGRSPKRRRVKARMGYLPEVSSRPASNHFPNLIGFISRIFVGRPPPSQMPIQRPSPAQYRTALATVLLKNPDLVLLDQPFHESDPLFVNELRELFRDQASKGKTVVFSSESILDAVGLCDRMAVFYDGKIQAVGTLNQLLSHPGFVRFISPLLPTPTTARVLEVIRAELATRPSMGEATHQPDSTTHSAPPPNIVGDPSPATTDQILAALVKTPGSGRPSELRLSNTTPIDDGKLAELTKPGSDT